MNRVFVTSDTHFGHENIIRYSNRPFRDWRAMGEALIERWNARVAEGDTVFFLGDFAMGPGAKPEYVIEVLNRLNGDIRIIRGNHDQPSKYGPGLRSVIETSSLKHVDVFDDQIHDEKIDGKDFVMCHFPLADWDGKHHGSIHLHGHTHTVYRQREVHNMVASRRYDIGVDMYGGPVQITGDLRYLNDPKGWE